MFDRRELSGGIVVLVPLELEAAGFLAAFTERAGGASRGAYRGLNLGLGSGDDLETVRSNRRSLCEALGIGPFAMVRQVHGPRVVAAGRRRAGAGFHHWDQALGQGDGITTAARAVPIAVLTADCVPVALADPVTGRLAVVHAGWRGIADGVMTGALARFPNPSAVLAAIGPHVGPDHYPVGDEVIAAIGATAPGDPVWARGPGGRSHLDLGATIERILRRAGVTSVARTRACTACRPERFYSYRRDGMTGRQGLVAVRR